MKKILSVLIALCLIAGLLPVVASAAAEAKVLVVSDAEANTKNTYTVAEGNAVYLITDGGAASTYGATEDNYNIKIDYTDGIPTVYLKGAELSTKSAPLQIIGAEGGVEDYLLVVEEDSTLESTGGTGLYVVSTNLTITGPGKLTIDSNKGYGIWFYNPKTTDETKQTFHDLTFEEANVDISLDNTEGGWGVAAGGSVRTMTVDGGTVKATTDGKSSAFYSINGEMIVTGGAKMEIDVNDACCFSAFNSFLLESGHLQLRTYGSAAPVFSLAENVRIKATGGSMDIVGVCVAYNHFDLTEYEGDYTAIVAQTEDGKGAKPYDPEEHKMGYHKYFQLTKGSSYEVVVKNGTTETPVAAEGDTITITARVAPAGKVFDKWEVNEGAVTLADPTATTTTFVMPKENVKVTALYKDVEEEGGEDAPVDDPDTDTPDTDTPDTDTTPDVAPDTTPDTTPDTDKGDTTEKPAAKGNGTGITVLLETLIILVSVGVGAAGVTLINRIKAQKAKAADEAPEEAAEETTEEAE